MPTKNVTIFSWDLGRAIRRDSGRRAQTVAMVPDIPVQVHLELDQAIYDTVANDPLLHQRMVDACRGEFDKAAFLIRGRLGELEDLLDANPEQAARNSRAFETSANEAAAAASRQAVQAANGVWARLQAERKEYRNYQIKCGVKVGQLVVGAGATIVGGAAAVATGGWGAAFTLWTLWRVSVDLGKTLADLIADEIDIQLEVDEGLRTLKTRFDQGGGAGKEAGASVLNALLQTEVTNMSKLKSREGLWYNKLVGVRKTAHDFAKNLNKTLEAAEKYEAELAASDLNWFKKKWRLRQLTKFKRKVTGLLDKIPAYHKRAEDGLEAHAAAKQAIAELESKSPNWTQSFDKYLNILVNVGVTAATGATAGWPPQATDLASEIGGWTALINDAATDVRDGLELA